MSVSPVIRLNAPAKINLTLAIHGRRPDGFHELESWVMRIDLCDELEFRVSDRWTLEVESADADVNDDEQNLVARAATLLARHADRSRSASVILRKAIPSGAGLGGGSSDAAATLRGLNTLWNLNFPDERLAEIAAELGSDIPFFFGPPSAVMRGRGERVEPAGDTWHGWVGLIVPPYKLSTAAVYARHRHDLSASHISLAEIRRLGSQGTRNWGLLLFNDLEPAAFALEPRLARLRETAQDAGGRAVRMTGSGSCLFSVFDEHAAALTWQRAVQQTIPKLAKVLVVRTL